MEIDEKEYRQNHVGIDCRDISCVGGCKIKALEIISMFFGLKYLQPEKWKNEDYSYIGKSLFAPRLAGSRRPMNKKWKEILTLSKMMEKLGVEVDLSEYEALREFNMPIASAGFEKNLGNVI